MHVFTDKVPVNLWITEILWIPNLHVTNAELLETGICNSRKFNDTFFNESYLMNKTLIFDEIQNHLFVNIKCSLVI